MYKLCKTEQSAQRQQTLEKGLLNMMLRCRYEDISVSDLCEYLGVPRKSFYRYFSSKDGALYALLDHTMMEFFNAEGSSTGVIPGTQMGDLDRYFTFWRQHSDLINALHRNGLAGSLVDRAMKLAQRERLMPSYIQQMPQETQSLALSFAVCGLISMVLQWYTQGFKTSPEEMTKIAVSILTKPLIH